MLAFVLLQNLQMLVLIERQRNNINNINNLTLGSFVVNSTNKKVLLYLVS